jgi:nucleoside-diphosphate-sugar epimerase
MTRFVARELSTSHWFDLGAARRDFGYQAVVSFDAGIERLREWLASRSPC